jgi:hypothetical protein
MRFGILGPLTVADGEQPIVVPGAKPRALLVLHAGRVVPIDRLVDSLWGEHLPADPANALQAIERPPTWTPGHIHPIRGSDGLRGRWARGSLPGPARFDHEPS